MRFHSGTRGRSVQQTNRRLDVIGTPVVAAGIYGHHGVREPDHHLALNRGLIHLNGLRQALDDAIVLDAAFATEPCQPLGVVALEQQKEVQLGQQLFQLVQVAPADHHAGYDLRQRHLDQVLVLGGLRMDMQRWLGQHGLIPGATLAAVGLDLVGQTQVAQNSRPAEPPLLGDQVEIQYLPPGVCEPVQVLLLAGLHAAGDTNNRLAHAVTSMLLP